MKEGEADYSARVWPISCKKTGMVPLRLISDDFEKLIGRPPTPIIEALTQIVDVISQSK